MRNDKADYGRVHANDPGLELKKGKEQGSVASKSLDDLHATPFQHPEQ